MLLSQIKGSGDEVKTFLVPGQQYNVCKEYLELIN